MQLTKLVLPFLVTLALTGCLGRSPRPEFYRLSPSAAAGGPVAELPALGLAIGAIEFPRYLDRTEMLARDGTHRLVPAGGPRWGAPLRSEVQRVLADDLAALLGTTRVVSYPTEPRFPLDYRVLVDVRAFEGAPAETVTLSSRWIVAGPDGLALAVEESRIEQPVASASWDAYAAAHSEALGALTRQIAERIAALATP
jgi:uncharacterized lipoprotein YmbA